MSPRKFYEHHKRSLAKTISYRIFIIISSYLLLLALTNDPAKSVNYTLVWNILASLIYFLHERFWNRIHWGKH